MAHGPFLPFVRSSLSPSSSLMIMTCFSSTTAPSVSLILTNLMTCRIIIPNDRHQDDQSAHQTTTSCIILAVNGSFSLNDHYLNATKCLLSLSIQLLSLKGYVLRDSSLSLYLSLPRIPSFFLSFVRTINRKLVSMEILLIIIMIIIMCSTRNI